MVQKVNAGTYAWVPYISVNNQVLGTSTKGVGYDDIQDAICNALPDDAHVSRV